MLDARRQDHLPHLALVGHVLADQQVLHHLLGDGRAALRTAGLGQVAYEGADSGRARRLPVLVEALVLGRDEGLLHMRRNFGERHPDAPMILLEHFRDALALAVEHDTGAGQSHALEPV